MLVLDERRRSWEAADDATRKTILEEEVGLKQWRAPRPGRTP